MPDRFLLLYVLCCLPTHRHCCSGSWGEGMQQESIASCEDSPSPALHQLWVGVGQCNSLEGENLFQLPSTSDALCSSRHSVAGLCSWATLGSLPVFELLLL